MPLFKNKPSHPPPTPRQVEQLQRQVDQSRSNSVSSNTSSHSSNFRSYHPEPTYNQVTLPTNSYPGEDPAITDARARVNAAEQAERQADDALTQARMAVRDAMDHVKALEREAEQDARLAQIKQSQARNISDRARPLGRHGPYV